MKRYQNRVPKYMGIEQCSRLARMKGGRDTALIHEMKGSKLLIYREAAGRISRNTVPTGLIFCT